MAEMFTPGSGSDLHPTLAVSGEYDPGITMEIDYQIRNMPGVVQYIFKKAQELLRRTGSKNFEIVLSTEKGASVFERQTDVFGRRSFIGRKMRWNAGRSAWGDNVGETSHAPEKQRPRAYVCPSNNMGIHEELTQAVLLKSAMGMSGR